jgi:FMN-dependent oxidoreductase (nitrilotriacetate monooxygenase family)
VVTSINHNESTNYGEELMAHDLRYERAEEFMEVCVKLWNSWEADAVVMDRERGIFADPAKVHRIEHDGRFFKSRGPLNVTRSPQNGPAIIQAGASAKGRAFAAKYAEAIFALQPFAEGAAEYYADVKGQMEDLGRNPDHCKILFGVQPIVGRTEQEAREKQEFHNSLVPVEAGLTILSGHLDYDFSRLNLDDVMEYSPDFSIQGLSKTYGKVAGRKLTLREVAQMHGQSVSLPQIVGAPEHVADQLEAHYDHAGGDGFMLTAIYSPGAIEEFVDLVVPVLQKRGRLREDYQGRTLREHLLQDE